jgi:hypothetical protein
MAISNMGPIRNSNGVQRLTGYLAALSWFISWFGEWGCHSIAPQKDGHLRQDWGSSARSGEPQSITNVGPNPRCSQTGRTPPPLRRSEQPCGEHCPGCRKGGARTPT